MVRHALAALAVTGTLLGSAAVAHAQYYGSPGYYPPPPAYRPGTPADMNRQFQDWWNRHFTIFRGGPDYDARRRREYAHWNWCRAHPYYQSCGYYR